jgi:hypothetical protein
MGAEPPSSGELRAVSPSCLARSRGRPRSLTVTRTLLVCAQVGCADPANSPASGGGPTRTAVGAPRALRHTATRRWERPPVSPGDHAAAAAQRSLSALRGRWPRGGRARCWSTQATLADVSRGCVATGRGRLGGPVQPLPTRGAAQIDITPSRALRERAVRPSEVVRACAPSRRIGAHTQHPPMQRRPSQAGPGAPRVSRDSSTMRTSRHLVGQHGSEPTCSDGSRVWRGLSEARGQRVQVERRDACGFMQRPGG